MKKEMHPEEADWTPEEREFSRSLRKQPAIYTAECLCPDDHIGLMEQKETYPNAETLRAHIARCRYCSDFHVETWKARQAAKALPERMSPSNAVSEQQGIVSLSHYFRWQRWLSPVMGFAVGGVVAANLLFLLWHAKEVNFERRLAASQKALNAQQKDMEALASKLDVAQKEAQRLRDHMKTSPRQQIPISPMQIASDARNLVQQTYRNGLVIPTISSQQEEDTATRGEQTIELIAPVNAFLQDTHPVFRWKGTTNEDAYTLILLPADNKKPEHFEVHRTHWKCTLALHPGEVYTWQIISSDQQSSSIAAHFKIVGPKTLQALNENEQTALLVSGIYNANIGLLDKAKEKFRAVLKLSPQDQYAKRFLQQIDEKERQGRR